MPLVLMTDDRKADWARAARALPRGSVVVVRARDAAQRRALAEQLVRPGAAADRRRSRLGRRHRRGGPASAGSAHARSGALARAPFPHWIITSSAHSLRALMGAAHLDAVFLSPVFATASHQGARPLTPVRAAFIAAHAPVPVYALGGVTARNAVLLAPAFSGIAAIISLL